MFKFLRLTRALNREIARNQALQDQLAQARKELEDVRQDRRVQLLCALPHGPAGLLGGQREGTTVHVMLRQPSLKEFYKII